MHYLQFLILSFSLFVLWPSTVSGVSEDESRNIFDNLFFNSSGYDKRFRPFYGKKSFEIKVSAYILDMYDISEKSHEFTVNMYLREEWVDPRLTFQPLPGRDYVNLEPEFSSKLWVPDTFIVNERAANVHSFTKTNQFHRIKSDGTILRSTRVTVTASCFMDLKWFPFDRHTCSIILESYGYSGDEFTYKWTPNKIGVSKNARSSVKFSLMAVKTNHTEETFKDTVYSRCAVDFFLKRNPLRYFQDIYFPATILPIVAFITLCTGTVQSRVHLSVLCMIAMTLFQTLTSTTMPQVSYQTALDFYVFNSAVMIFNAVLVNFVVYFFMQPKDSDQVPLRPVNGTTDDTDIPSDFKVGRPRLSSRFQQIIYGMCEKTKYTMPFFFVVFNVLYWPVVLIASNTMPEDFILMEDHTTS